MQFAQVKLVSVYFFHPEIRQTLSYSIMIVVYDYDNHYQIIMLVDTIIGHVNLCGMCKRKDRSPSYTCFCPETQLTYPLEQDQPLNATHSSPLWLWRCKFRVKV